MHIFHLELIDFLVLKVIIYYVIIVLCYPYLGLRFSMIQFSGIAVNMHTFNESSFLLLHMLTKFWFILPSNHCDYRVKDFRNHLKHHNYNKSSCDEWLIKLRTH